MTELQKQLLHIFELAKSGNKDNIILSYELRNMLYLEGEIPEGYTYVSEIEHIHKEWCTKAKKTIETPIRLHLYSLAVLQENQGGNFVNFSFYAYEKKITNTEDINPSFGFGFSTLTLSQFCALEEGFSALVRVSYDDESCYGCRYFIEPYYPRAKAFEYKYWELCRTNPPDLNERLGEMGLLDQYGNPPMDICIEFVKSLPTLKL